ncbi:MAG: hypothetical protein NWS20_04285 [Rickettsiaceae bacterium]|jgi:hypothetical protein|nr:hypothetical protein [Rickettsiaceae bacterium]MDP5020589.1 hypothetical protein [Rickettsiaceae bacterium]
MTYYNKKITESTRSGVFDKKPTNGRFIASSAILATLIYLLNQCTAIYQCACVFTAILLMLMLNTTSKQAYKYISIGVLLSLPIYILSGSLGSGLVLASLVSLLISSFAAIYTGNLVKDSYSLPVVLVIALLVAASIDGLLMSAYFTTQTNFSFYKVLSIFNRELFFKAVYGISALTIYYLGIYGTRKSKVV